MNSPAPINATSASAISDTTNMLRNGLRLQPTLPPRPPIFSVSAKFGVHDLIAGASAMMTAVNMEMLSVNNNTRQSSDRSMSFRSINSGRNDHSTVRPAYAMANPTTPAIRAQRRAQAKLFFSPRRLRQQQIGQV